MNKLSKLILSILIFLFMSVNGFADDVETLLPNQTVTGGTVQKDYKFVAREGEVHITLTGDVIGYAEPLVPTPLDDILGSGPQENCPAMNIGTCFELGLPYIPGMMGSVEKHCTFTVPEGTTVCVRIFGASDDNGYTLTVNFIPASEEPGNTEEAKNEEQNEGRCYAGLREDPIDTATGAQLLSHTLLTVQGVVPLSFSINYHSLLLKDSILGRAWSTEQFATRLEEQTNGDVLIHWSENQYNLFTKNADGSYSATHITCQFDTLVKNPDGGFTLKRNNRTRYDFDQVGNLVALRNPQGQSRVFTRDVSGRMIQITEPVSGAFLKYSYNADGLLESVSEPLGRQVKFTYDANRNLTTITDAAGQTTTYTYNEHGQTLTGTNVEGVTYFTNTYGDEFKITAQDDALPNNQVSTLNYDKSKPGRIVTTLTNGNGETEIFTYDENYHLLSYQDGEGNITTHTYDTNGKRTSTTDANNNTTRFEYDANGNLTTRTDAAGNTTRMVYDDNSNLLSVTNALGKTSTFSYDDNNNRTSVTDALGNTTRYTYNSHGQVVTETGPSGAVTTYEYENGLPVRVTDPEGNTQTLRYDAAGRLISTTDAEGHTTTFAYDGVNRLVSVTDALNRTVSMTYDSRDNLLTSTDAKGYVTRRHYDGNGNLISQINALAQKTRYEYDGEGRLVKVIDAKGHVTQLGYDAKGRLISTTDALGNTQQLSYDAADNLLAAIDALGKTVVTYNYDGLNNPISVTNALGHQTQSAYDALGRLTRVTDPLNWATQFNYDDNDRLVASVDAKGGQSRQTFDPEGNQTSLTDPNSHQTTFQFDNNGRLVQETSASGGTVRYSYNARDLLATVTNARGQQRQLEYDAVGRLTRLTDADGTVSYTYDHNDNVLTVTDASGTISREYDALDRVSKYTDSQGNTLQYAYDAVGNLETLTYPDGKQVFYEYDAADQLTKVTDWAGRKTRYAYDANGRLVEVIRPNGTRMTYTYDVAGQLVQQQDMASDGKVIRQFDFVYNAAGDIVKEQVVPEPAPFPFIPTTMTYTSANRLATYNGKAVTFDADGNMTLGPLNGELVDFTFDARNRLSSVGETTYRYDAENQRIAVSIAGQATRYVINPQPVLSQTLVRTAPDGTQTFYVYGLGLIGEETAGVYQAYHFDLRGSTVALSDATGNVVKQFQYSPFGGLVSHNPADVDTPFLYNGRDGVMTDDTGLYYMRARYYNPETRRFVNQDILLGSVDDGQSLNRFAYVTGEPVSFVDPFGLAPSENMTFVSDFTVWSDPVLHHLGAFITPNSTTISNVTGIKMIADELQKGNKKVKRLDISGHGDENRVDKGTLFNNGEFNGATLSSPKNKKYVNMIKSSLAKDAIVTLYTCKAGDGIDYLQDTLQMAKVLDVPVRVFTGYLRPGGISILFEGRWIRVNPNGLVSVDEW
jgi:RHS repeat-associated protein